MRKYITKDWTFLGYLLGSIWPWIVVVGVVAFISSGRDIWIVGVLFGLFLIYVIVVPTLNARRLRGRLAALQAFAQQHGLRVANDIEAVQHINALGAIDEMHEARDNRVSNLLVGKDWEYCDFKYNLYGRTKYGEYRQATVYYGVMSTKLPRSMPNVFFDSIKARRRQFRFHFAKKQRHSLEGDFDKFFVTYFPPGYTIDSLSFISPDVMWVMRDAANYDIEIVGDRLFLYGPLYDPAKQIPDMSAKIAPIKKELLDNILTYRDERLPFEEGRKRVSLLGASLARSKFWKTVSIVTFVFYMLMQLVVRILSDN